MDILPIECILGKLAIAPVGDIGTDPYHLLNLFPSALGDRRASPESGDGCRMWFMNLGHSGGPVTCNKIRVGCWSVMYQGERFHVNVQHHHLSGGLPFSIHVLS
jgi:hypothetical protein